MDHRDSRELGEDSSPGNDDTPANFEDCTPQA